MNVLTPHAWQPELRRALISARPDFFGLSPEEQLRYRVKLPDDDRQAIVAALLKAHGHPHHVELAEQESNGRIAVEEQHRINEWLQPLVGIGEDAFSLNESFLSHQSILDFPTLLSYDQDDHDYQEQARQRAEPSHVARPYSGSLHATWARCMLGGRLCYLALSMVASEAIRRIDDIASEEIERLIPHRYVPGPDNGRTEDGFVQWNHRVEAGGQEALLDELMQRVWAYQNERVLDLRAEFNSMPAMTVFLDGHPGTAGTEQEQHLHILFSGPVALAQVRFTSFLEDCRAMAQPSDALTEIHRREAERAIRFVNEQHQELLRTFDARVVPLRRRTRILMHPDAFDALNGDGDA
jgi:hypothetical protein